MDAPSVSVHNRAVLATWVRIVVILAALVPAVAAWLHGRRGVAAGLGVVALVQTWALLRYACVLRAGRAYRNNRRDAAWRMLRTVPFGGRTLRRDHRAYYHLLRAACQIDREEWPGVDVDAGAVLATERAGPANHAAALGALARSALARGEREQARAHVARARTLKGKPSLSRLLDDIENELQESPPDGAGLSDG